MIVSYVKKATGISMTTARRLLLTAILLASLAVTACGGGSTSAAGSWYGQGTASPGGHQFAEYMTLTQDNNGQLTGTGMLCNRQDGEVITGHGTIFGTINSGNLALQASTTDHLSVQGSLAGNMSNGAIHLATQQPVNGESATLTLQKGSQSDFTSLCNKLP